MPRTRMFVSTTALTSARGTPDSLHGSVDHAVDMAIGNPIVPPSYLVDEQAQPHLGRHHRLQELGFVIYRQRFDALPDGCQCSRHGRECNMAFLMGMLLVASGAMLTRRVLHGRRAGDGDLWGVKIAQAPGWRGTPAEARSHPTQLSPKWRVGSVAEWFDPWSRGSFRTRPRGRRSSDRTDRASR